ncbi:hypothetical protein VZT92_005598 [Zoarces viviparus]|uniref:Uncharacterized protein n=1 Tax=Zoarces viviparus TaxID=48416 RepID=A0AAW1FTS2_ZOAVI
MSVFSSSINTIRSASPSMPTAKTSTNKRTSLSFVWHCFEQVFASRRTAAVNRAMTEDFAQTQTLLQDVHNTAAGVEGPELLSVLHLAQTV